MFTIIGTLSLLFVINGSPRKIKLSQLIIWSSLEIPAVWSWALFNLSFDRAFRCKCLVHYRGFADKFSVNLDCTLLSKEIRKRCFNIFNAFWIISYLFRNTPVSHRCIYTNIFSKYGFGRVIFWAVNVFIVSSLPSMARAIDLW